MAGRERHFRSGGWLPCLGCAGWATLIVELGMVESSRLETITVLCLQWFRSRSNKSSSRLEIGLGPGRLGPAPVPLRELRNCPPFVRRSVVGLEATERFRSDRLPPNMPKIITIYASTSLREIQGLEACVHLGSCGENLACHDRI